MGTHSSDMTRRGFLATSLTGLAAAGLAGFTPVTALGQEIRKKKEKSANGIIFRELGKTGMKVPIISMGVGGVNDPSLIQAAYEAGVRHFDTAANYQFGRNEQLVGRVIKKLGVRDKTFIATKEWTPAQRGEMTTKQAKEKFIGLLEGSLRRLKTDYVDICYVHDVSSAAATSDEGAMEALAELKKQGKVRAAGTSTHTGMAEVINECVRTGFYDVILTSINVSMADDTALLEAIGKAGAKGIGIVAMKTLAGGARLPNQATLQQYPLSVVNKASLKWVMRNENITTSIPGFTNLEHLAEDFSVVNDLEYTPDEYKFLGDNNLKLGLGFCRQCKDCLATCPHNVDIPRLMRTHMYAAQYSDFYLARTTLDEIPKAAGLQACASCETCTAKCSHLVDVAYRIGDLKLMYA